MFAETSADVWLALLTPKGFWNGAGAVPLFAATKREVRRDLRMVVLNQTGALVRVMARIINCVDKYIPFDISRYQSTYQPPSTYSLVQDNTRCSGKVMECMERDWRQMLLSMEREDQENLRKSSFVAPKTVAKFSGKLAPVQRMLCLLSITTGICVVECSGI